MRRILPLLLVVLTSTLASCTAGMSAGTAGGSRYHITPEALDAIRGNTQNLHQAIQQLRPIWLQSRGATAQQQLLPLVYVDGIRYGELESLRQIPISDVREVELIPARDATTQYGTGHAGGIVAVTIGP